MKRLIVIGGGFAGTYAAKALENEFDVTLIDTKDYFEYTPGILRTIVEPDHFKKMQRMHSSYLKKAKVLVGHVREVGKGYVRFGDIDDGDVSRKVSYDYLLICSGSSYNLPIKEQEVLIGSRVDHLKKAYGKLMESKRVLIIGGGLVGVELAAEICTHCGDKKVVLMHSRDKLIPRNDARTIKYVEKFLRRKGVELIFEERMKSVKGRVCLTESGKRIEADVIFLTVGIVPNYDFMKKNFSKALNDGNQIKVSENLQVVGLKNVFAAGDIVGIKEEKTAQNAERQAEVIVKNLRALKSGGDLKRYESKKGMMVISLGKYDGVVEGRNIVFGGKIAALMKWGIEKWIMMGYK